MELCRHSVSGEAQELRKVLLVFSGAESGILYTSDDVVGHLLLVEVHSEVELDVELW
jgi:hypothetical protein